jgi:hypothetical protein
VFSADGKVRASIDTGGLAANPNPGNADTNTCYPHGVMPMARMGGGESYGYPSRTMGSVTCIRAPSTLRPD